MPTSDQTNDYPGAASCKNCYFPLNNDYPDADRAIEYGKKNGWNTISYDGNNDNNNDDSQNQNKNSLLFAGSKQSLQLQNANSGHGGNNAPAYN